MSRFAVLLSILSLSACASTAPQPVAEQTSLPREVHWVVGSAEYRAVFQQTFRVARQRLEQLIAAHGDEPWAVALDGDETVVSNATYELERPEGEANFNRQRWSAWIARREATPLPGAVSFLSWVRQAGGQIAIVTNRLEEDCAATRENFRQQQIPHDVILCRTDVRDKRPRWRAVERGEAEPGLPPAKILIWIGDNIHDFPGLDQELRFAEGEAFTEFGDRFFILPNPLYGSWEDNPVE